MNTINPENIPSHIFEWMETYSFSSLTDEQKIDVLKFFSEEEYDELHKSSIIIKSIQEPVFSETSEEGKQDLLNRFESKHETKRKRFVLYNTFVKVAASLVLLGCGWILNYLIPGKTTTDTGFGTLVDTVYLTKEIITDPIKIYDTLYVKTEAKSEDKTPQAYKNFSGNSGVAKEPENNSSVYMDEVGSPLNRQKRNSMKDDSLVKEFSVIML